MTLADRIAETLASHLGAHTADVVARHLCAKYDVSDEVSPEEREKLREFLRRGLVAYVGAETAERLADECLARAGAGGDSD